MNTFSFSYELKSSKRARNLRISINQHGKVTVTKPWLLPMIAVNHFIASQEQWVKEKLSQIQSHQKNNNEIWYKGRKYQILFKPGRFHLSFKDTNCIVSGLSLASARREMERLFKQEAHKVIFDRVKQNALQMQIEYADIRLKDQSSRWGSCSTRKNLNFNWRLVMAPPEVLNYVVIHELSHIKHMDHSKHFWQLVEKFDPEYREHRRWLRRNGSALKIV